MDQDFKKKLIEEFENNYVLIKKGTLYYLMGGVLVITIAIIGLSYVSVISAIKSETAKLAIFEVNKIKNTATKDQEKISEILSSTPDLLSRIALLESKIENLINTTEGFSLVKQSTLDLSNQTHENRRAISVFATAFNNELSKLLYIYPEGYFRDPELTALVKVLNAASKESAHVLNLR